MTKEIADNGEITEHKIPLMKELTDQDSVGIHPLVRTRRGPALRGPRRGVGCVRRPR